MRLCKEELEMVLDDFTKEVQAKHLRRIDYSAWKELKKADAWYIDICEPYGGLDMPMLGISDKNGILLYEDDVYDGSICQFLFEKMVREGDIMPPKDYYDQILGSSNVSNTLTWSGVPGNTYSSTGTAIYGYSSEYVSKDEFTSTIASIDAKIATKEDKKTTNVKENSKMKGFNFDFGPCNNSAVKMSVYGLAVKNTSGTWVSYDVKGGNLIDVDILNFDGAKYLYKMPVAIKDIVAGDIVVHAGKPMFVVGIGSNSKSLNVVDPISGEKKEIMLTRSPFGFDFATKIVNFLGNFMDSAATADSPFGNMWMLMLASGDNSFSDIAPLMLMSGNGAKMDPMMMYFMLGNGGKNDNLLPLMLMMNGNKTNSCKCGSGCHCGEATPNA